MEMPKLKVLLDGGKIRLLIDGVEETWDASLLSQQNAERKIANASCRSQKEDTCNENHGKLNQHDGQGNHLCRNEKLVEVCSPPESENSDMPQLIDDSNRENDNEKLIKNSSPMNLSETNSNLDNRYSPNDFNNINVRSYLSFENSIFQTAEAIVQSESKPKPPDNHYITKAADVQNIEYCTQNKDLNINNVRNNDNQRITKTCAQSIVKNVIADSDLFNNNSFIINKTKIDQPVCNTNGIKRNQPDTIDANNEQNTKRKAEDKCEKKKKRRTNKKSKGNETKKEDNQQEIPSSKGTNKPPVENSKLEPVKTQEDIACEVSPITKQSDQTKSGDSSIEPAEVIPPETKIIEFLLAESKGSETVVNVEAKKMLAAPGETKSLGSVCEFKASKYVYQPTIESQVDESKNTESTGMIGVTNGETKKVENVVKAAPTKPNVDAPVETKTVQTSPAETKSVDIVPAIPNGVESQTVQSEPFKFLAVDKSPTTSEFKSLVDTKDVMSPKTHKKQTVLSKVSKKTNDVLERVPEAGEPDDATEVNTNAADNSLPDTSKAVEKPHANEESTPAEIKAPVEKSPSLNTAVVEDQAVLKTPVITHANKENTQAVTKTKEDKSPSANTKTVGGDKRVVKTHAIKETTSAEKKAVKNSVQIHENKAVPAQIKTTKRVDTKEVKSLPVNTKTVKDRTVENTPAKINTKQVDSLSATVEDQTGTTTKKTIQTKQKCNSAQNKIVEVIDKKEVKSLSAKNNSMADSKTIKNQTGQGVKILVQNQTDKSTPASTMPIEKKLADIAPLLLGKAADKTQVDSKLKGKAGNSVDSKAVKTTPVESKPGKALPVKNNALKLQPAENTTKKQLPDKGQKLSDIPSQTQTTNKKNILNQSKHLGQKSDKKKRNKSPVNKEINSEEVVLISKLTVSLEDDFKTILKQFRDNLQESGMWIENVLILLGLEKAFEFYEKTRVIQEEGGLLVKDGSRKRKPGGVLIQLLNEDENISKEIIDKILFQNATITRKMESKARRQQANMELKEKLKKDGYL